MATDTTETSDITATPDLDTKTSTTMTPDTLLHTTSEYENRFTTRIRESKEINMF
jgi:hypothetical protein